MFSSSSGRHVGYDDVGDIAGAPVVYLHGTPDSRLARHPDDAEAKGAGVRLVAVDRPGYGMSTAPSAEALGAVPTRRFAEDLAELLDDLHIDRARLLGWSGGALTALAAATAPALAGRLSAVTIVAGIVPREAFDTPSVRDAAPERMDLIELATHLPQAELADMVAPMLAPFPCDLPLALEHQLEQRHGDDQAALAAIPGGIEQMGRALVEAVRHGLGGVMADVVAQNYPGVVAAESVSVPVDLWYGAADRVAPPAFGAWYADHLPRATLHVVEDAGHFLPFTHWPRLLVV